MKLLLSALSALLLSLVCHGQRSSSRFASQGCALAASDNGISPSDISKTTGNPGLDAAFTNEYNLLRSAFGVNPSLLILNDTNGSNAFAIPQSVQPGFQGSVLLGYRLMTEEFTAAPINFTIPAIMAHEFGHIYQFSHGGGPETTKLMELQADYLSGWYMRNRESVSSWADSALRQALYTFYTKGDYAFNNPGHHGTPAERMQAALAGIKDLSPGPAGAYQNSLHMIAAFDDGQGMASDEPNPGVSRPNKSKGQQPGGDNEFARVLRSVLSERATNFASIRGRKTDDGGSFTFWDASIALPGISDCQIILRHGETFYTYACSGKEQDDKEEVKSDIDRIVESMKPLRIECDPPEGSWARRYCDQNIDILVGGSRGHYHVLFELDTRN